MTDACEESARPAPQKQSTSGRAPFGDPAIIFLLVAVSFLLLLSQNPSSVLPRTTLYFDAAHYLETAKRLYETALSFFSSGSLSKGQLDALAFYLLLDGPVLPGAGALLFLILHRAPGPTEWQALVAMQCFFQASCSGFLYLLARKLLDKRWLAVLAAVAWTCYPATIASCNSYLTEPLACAISVGLLFFLTGFFEAGGDAPPLPKQSAGIIYAKCFLSGIFFALLAFLKPALAPASAVICALALLSVFMAKESKAVLIKRAALRAGLAFLGVALVMVPWLSFGYAARGKITLLPSRRAVYNITMGCSVEGDGWGLYPNPPVTMMFDDNEPALPVLLGLVEQSPPEMANLTLRKMTRFLNLPWNDYRYKLLGVNFKQQAIYQLVLVGMGFSGLLLLFAFSFNKSFSTSKKLSIAAMVIMILGHLIYLPFEGIARYGITAMPFILLAATFMLEQLIDKRSKRLLLVLYLTCLTLWILYCRIDFTPLILFVIPDPYAAMLCMAAKRTFLTFAAAYAIYKIGTVDHNEKNVRLSLTLCGAIFVALAASISLAFATSNRVAQSWQCTLKHGYSAHRNVFLSDTSKAAWALLLIDGDHRTPEAIFTLNGKRLSNPIRSIYQYDTEHYDLEDWLNQFSSLIRKSPDTIRRWRAIEVPLTQLNKGWNQIEVEPEGNAALTIYGDYVTNCDNGRLLLPSQLEVSPGKFFNDSDEEFDSRIEQNTFSPVANANCSLYRDGKSFAKDLSPSLGIQKGNYRMYLLLGYPHKPQQLSLDQNAAIHSVKQMLAEQTKGSLTLQKTNGLVSRFQVTLPPECLSSSHFGVRVSGKCRSQSGAEFTVAGTVSQQERFISSVLPGTPRIVQSTSDWKPFSVSSELPCQTIQGKSSPVLQVELQAVNNVTELSDLQVEIEALEKPQFSGHSIRYF